MHVRAHLNSSLSQPSNWCCRWRYAALTPPFHAFAASETIAWESRTCDGCNHKPCALGKR